VKYGLILNGRSVARDIELAKRAEVAGFEAVFEAEFFNRNALVRLAAIAAATDTIQVGSGIANTFTRSPVVLASAAMDLDEIAEGRLVLGLGTGLERMNVEWYGVPFSKPVSRSRELFALLRYAFATRGPGFTWSGTFYELAIPAYQRHTIVRADIPIWLAAVGRVMTGAAGEIADGMVGHPVHTRRWHREVTLPLLREGEEKADREAGACPLYPYVITSIQEDRELAIRDAKRQIGFSFTVDHYRQILELHGLEHVGHECRRHLPKFDLEAMADAIPDELVEEIAIACTPDEVADRMLAWQELTPMCLFYAASIGVAPERTAACLDHLFEQLEGSRD